MCCGIHNIPIAMATRKNIDGRPAVAKASTVVGSGRHLPRSSIACNNCRARKVKVCRKAHEHDYLQLRACTDSCWVFSSATYKSEDMMSVQNVASQMSNASFPTRMTVESPAPIVISRP